MGCAFWHHSIMKEWRYGRDHSTIRLSLIFLIFLNFLDFSTAFDCRRYVFAPVCRGVTSKRSDPTLTQQNRLYYSILQQMRDSYDQSKLDDENHSSIQVDVPTAVKKPFNFENLNLRGNHHRGKRDLGDDLGTFTGFLKRDFYYYPLKSLEKSSLRSKRNADDDLESFSNFFKRNSGSGGHDELGSFSNFLKKRSAFPDLGGFSNFLKKSHRFKRERGGMSPFEELGRFSNFYKKRSDLESFSTFNGGKPSGDLESFSTFSKRPKPLQYGKRSAGNNDLEAFSTFGKRSAPADLEAFSTLGKRSAGDLESFSTFGKRSASSTRYEDLDGFSGFMTKKPDVDFSQ